ncbi:MAG: glycosyltransferase family 2 protein [Treponema sp.]|nr:glycosyltransferase family 2 protein [Treponema sp.]
MPKISIILPCYNVSKFLEKCIHSLINQTEKDIEIIFVDDCSPDDSSQIISRYAKKDKRIKLLKMEKNGGQGAARNLGRDNATGEYIWFVDPDDYIETDACEVLYNEAKKDDLEILGFQPCNVVTAENYKYINRNIFTSSIRWPINKIFSPKTQGDKLIRIFSVTPWRYITKNSFLKVRFPEVRHREDTIYTPILFSECNRMKFISYTAYNYNLRAGSDVASSINEKKVFCAFNVFYNFDNYINKAHLSKKHFLYKYALYWIIIIRRTLRDYKKVFGKPYVLSDFEKNISKRIKHYMRKNIQYSFINNFLPLGLIKLLYKDFQFYYDKL